MIPNPLDWIGEHTVDPLLLVLFVSLYILTTFSSSFKEVITYQKKKKGTAYHRPIHQMSFQIISHTTPKKKFIVVVLKNLQYPLV